MTKMLRASRAELRDPGDSQVTMTCNENAGDCDGSICGLGRKDEAGEWWDPGPHHHLVESGLMPQAGPRVWPI
jgi:hypothetical protein